MLRRLAAPRVRGPLSVAALLAACGFAPTAVAQQAQPAAPEAPKAGAQPEKPAHKPPEPQGDADVDALIEDLVKEEPADDDVAWLFSDASEYAEPTVLAGKTIAAPSLPQRGEGSRRTWDPRWREFEVGNYILTGSALAIGMTSSVIPATPERWHGHNSFDEGVRDAIGIEDYEAGIWARDGSDLLLSVSIAYPLLFDSLIAMYWYRQSHAVAAQMALITTEAISVAAAVQGVTAGFASRERPYGRNCGTSIDGDLKDCSSRKRYRSFFSGHTAMAFAAAGVSCSHHMRHRVYGNPTADGTSCGVAFVAAAGTGALRIVGDQHYGSDVLIGATIGTLSGFGIPWLLHYGPLARPAQGREATAIRWSVVGVPNGLGVGGEF
ncbi:MAG TPA: phosphatase PAP2 family protein [Polyangiaceae bacterium]|nr:phosphatase PAP2 family protein [Polyangiaceae bacterium]